MEVLRRQMAENLEKLRRSGAVAPETGRLPQVASRSQAQGLRESLARRIGALDASDPQFQQKAADVFVESILVSEFGEKMVNDAGFRQMIRKVATAMNADPAIAGDLARLFSELRSGES